MRFSKAHKLSVRGITGMRVRRGIIKREPCEICAGSYAQAHHPDYADSISINWLCPRCHSAVHRGTIAEEIMQALKLTAAERRVKIRLRIAEPIAIKP